MHSETAAIFIVRCFKNGDCFWKFGKCRHFAYVGRLILIVNGCNYTYLNNMCLIKNRPVGLRKN